VLRDQPGLFGPVASHPTAWRTIAGLAPGEYRRLAGARAQARAAAWAAGAGPAGDEVIIDVDAALVTTKADKQDAAATYKRSYGHHPLLAMCAETGEVLTVMLRAGNAGSNTAADHVITLGAALAQLPEAWRSGHESGDQHTEASKSVLVRAAAAGASHWFAEECRDRNIGYSLGFYIDHRVRDAFVLVQEEDWEPAIGPGGRRRSGAEVVELTGLVNLDAWPDATRLIERPHPRARRGTRRTPTPTPTRRRGRAAPRPRRRRARPALRGGRDSTRSSRRTPRSPSTAPRRRAPGAAAGEA
jgi:Transposase DDE domain group 1